MERTILLYKNNTIIYFNINLEGVLELKSLQICNILHDSH